MHSTSFLRLSRVLTLIASVAVLTGCFGEGDGKQSTAGAPLAADFTGRLVDSGVSGAAWEETGGQSGLTGDGGDFRYSKSALVTFSVGSIVLGTVPGAPYVTPVELTDGFGPTAGAALNQAVFIQSIDVDQDPSNGISISESTRSAAEGLALDFTAADADFDIAVAAVVAAIAPGNRVVTRAAALSHFYETYAALGGSDTFNFSFPGFPPVGGGVTYELVFEDNFEEGDAPDSEKWNIETGYGDNGWGNDEWQLYTESPDNIRVEDGNLVIQARCDEPPCGIRDGTVTSGRLNTKDKFEFKYGIVQARLKPPVGEGSWPAFWSLGASFPDTPWPRAGEIDFMEMSSEFFGANFVLFNLHWCPDGSQAPTSCTRRDAPKEFDLGESVGADFRLFEARWTSESVAWSVDGKEFYEVDIDPATMEEFLKEFFLILNVAMGGTLGSNREAPSGNEVWPQTMLVDYVRVFQQVGGTDPGDGGGPEEPEDQAAPELTTVSIASSNANPALAKAGDVVTLSIESNEPITAPQVTFAAGFEATVNGSATTWTATRTLTGEETVPLAFSVAFSDLAGNDGDTVTATTDVSAVMLDFTPPTVTIGGAPPSFANIITIPLTIVFSEPVSGFDIDDIQVMNGSKSGFVATGTDNTTYSVTVAPTGIGDLTITINPGAAADAAGNLNGVGDAKTVANLVPPGFPLTAVDFSSSNDTTEGFARLGDVVTLALTVTNAVEIETPDVVFTINSMTFEPDGAVMGSGTNWQATLTMTGALPEGAIGYVVSNIVSLEGVAGDDRTDQQPGGTTITYDRTAPGLSITGIDDEIEVREGIEVTFDFGEAVVDFDLGDITALPAGSTAADLTTADNAVWTAVVTPANAPNQTFEVSVAAGAATDPAGNPNPAASDSGLLGDLETRWDLVWSDNFEGGALNGTNWTVRTDTDDDNSDNYCAPPCDATDGAQSYNGANVAVGTFQSALDFTGANAFDALKITANSGMPLVSGLVDTNGKQEFTYGRIEIDAIMAAATGTLPFFKLLPATEENYGPWPRSGEIDIVNAPNPASTLQHTLRYGLAESEDTTATDTSVVTAPQFYPVRYALEWEAGEMRWYVTETDDTFPTTDPALLDTGTEVHVATQIQDNWYAYYPGADGVPVPSSGAEPFDQDFYLAIGLALEAEPPVSNTLTLAIDEVRVYRCVNGGDLMEPSVGCGTPVDPGVVPVVATAPPYNSAPYTETLDVYIDGPASFAYDDPDGGSPINAQFVPETFQEGFATVTDARGASWNVNLDSGGGSGGVLMRSADNDEVAGFFDLSGSEGAGELLFRMRVNSAGAGANLAVSMDSSGGGGGSEDLDFVVGEWRNYSVSIADLLANPVPPDDILLDVANVTNVFKIEASGASVNFDLDDIKVKVACRVETCKVEPRFRTTQDVFDADFEGLVATDSSALAPSGAVAPNLPEPGDWAFFATVFDGGGTKKFSYGPFPAPNAAVDPVNVFVAAVATGEGGTDQGTQQLSAFSDYGCCRTMPPNGPIDIGHGNGTDRVEISVFREFTLTADDLGSVYSFSFDAKNGNIELDTTAIAFISTIAANGDRTNFETIDMTNLPTDAMGDPAWTRYTIELPIADAELVGQSFQFGFQSTASNFDGSGNFYDNLVVTKAR